ncbi:MAG: putative bifunctional diguanylate cyclase/phosphodiesterase [Betaproteobacteria bacterium]
MNTSSPPPEQPADRPHGPAAQQAVTRKAAAAPDATPTAAGSRPRVGPLLRLAALAASAYLLARAGALSWPGVPAVALALPCGLALAALVRWGWRSLPAPVLGLFVALLGLAPSVFGAVLGAVAGGAAAATAWMLLRRLGFDPRLERGRDALALSASVPAAALLPAIALGLAGDAWLGRAVPPVPGPWAAQALQHAVALSLGGLLAAWSALALDRRLLPSLKPTGAWGEAVLGVAVWLLCAALLQATGSGTALALLALLLPHVALAVMALRGQLALAAGGALVAVAAASSPWRAGALLPGADAAGFAVWVTSLLVLLLVTQGAASEAQARSQRWEWALDGSRLGVADWHLQRQEGFASIAWRALAAFHDRRWTPAAWLERVHVDDRAAVEQALVAVTEGSAGRMLIELRMSPAGTAWRWFESTLLVIERDADGRPTRLLATLADVQERRDAQERQLMSVNLFRHLHEGMLVTDPELRVLDVNPAYSEIVGVQPEDLLGTVPSLLRPTADDPVAREQRAAMWVALHREGRWRGELVERCGGELRTLQATISAVRGSAGELRYHVVVIADVTEQRAQRAQLERQALYDELTRLPNRAHLTQLLDDAMRAADRDGYLLVVCYLDLDRFKPVNDKFGHAAGDRLLSMLAGRLRSALRSRQDWTDSAARLGGDEFVLLLRAGTLEEARLAVERVLRVVGQPYLLDPRQDPVQVTASMGATVYPIDRSDADTLLRHADHAMYQAKQSGRNGWLFFDPEHRRRTEERVMAIGRVQEALDQREFALFYQPKVDMRSGRVHGFEALLRWDHPSQGLIAPSQFLPLIEHTGLSSRIGDWVIAQALDHLSSWRRKGLEFSVSVNVSARHLQEPDFSQRLAELLARHAQPLASWLEIEITESAAHADIEATSALLTRCRTLGVRFALDDFGTGYSTLTYLKRLPVDVLKIDRSFVHQMLDDPQDRAIVEGVIGLAGTFGCTVVAEGVESPAQARALLDMGCALGQGNGIAAPMQAAQVGDWIQQYRGVFAIAPAPGKPVVDPGVGRLGR